MLRLPSLSLNLGRRGSGADVVGLDVQPGLVAAVKARVNGHILAERAAAQPLDADTVREGEVVDVEALSHALRELFADGTLGKRVRVGIANQRTVMRTLDLPPVSDRKELAAAVRFQAQDQVPMPLSNAVLDFHPLGLIDTPAGSRQRVVLVAAQRDMVERLLAAVRGAGLIAEGVDLSAFALIRSLYDPSEALQRRPRPVLERRRPRQPGDRRRNHLPLHASDRRRRRGDGGRARDPPQHLAGVGARAARERRLERAGCARPQSGLVEEPAPAPDGLAGKPAPDSGPQLAPQPLPSPSLPRRSRRSRLRSTRRGRLRWATPRRSPRFARANSPPTWRSPPPTPTFAPLLERGVREISGEIRNSLDFHRTQDQGGEIAHVSLSGAALDLPGFSAALQTSLGIEVRRESVGLADAELEGRVSTHRLAVAAGLATAEAPR